MKPKDRTDVEHLNAGEVPVSPQPDHVVPVVARSPEAFKFEEERYRKIIEKLQIPA